MVAIGRPKGERGSYRQWEEGGIAPQVVFEILSPGNRFAELLRKLRFYQRYGVEEYYVYDPDRGLLDGWLRTGASASSDLARWRTSSARDCKSDSNRARVRIAW